MLTGDRRRTAELVARSVGCDETFPELLPAKKSISSAASSAAAKPSAWSVMASTMRPLSPSPLSASQWAFAVPTSPSKPPTPCS